MGMKRAVLPCYAVLRALLAVVCCLGASAGAGPPAECVYPNVQVDLMFVIDTSIISGSTDTHVYDNLQSMIELLRYQVADFRLALTTFNDQPFEFSGYDGFAMEQYCNKLQTTFDASLTDLIHKYDETAQKQWHNDKSYSQADSLGAMAQQSNNPEAKWRTKPSDGGYELRKVMFVVTEGTYRFPYDGLSTDAGNALPANDGSPDYKCGEENFYTEDQAANLIKQSGVRPVIFTEYNRYAPDYEKFFKSHDIDGKVLSLDDGENPSADYLDLRKYIQRALDITCAPTVEPPTVESTITETSSTQRPEATTTTSPVVKPPAS